MDLRRCDIGRPARLADVRGKVAGEGPENGENYVAYYLFSPLYYATASFAAFLSALRALARSLSFPRLAAALSGLRW